MRDIDIYTIELAKSSELSKALPPKLKYKFMKWLKSMRPNFGDKQTDRRRMVETAKAELETKLLELYNKQSLKKNEIITSTYSDGSVLMDFGSEVPENIKKAAFDWAKKRGLKAKEASLVKNSNSPERVLFSSPKEGSVRVIKNITRQIIT